MTDESRLRTAAISVLGACSNLGGGVIFRNRSLLIAITAAASAGAAAGPAIPIPGLAAEPHSSAPAEPRGCPLSGEYDRTNPFARILRGELSASRVYEDRHVLVIVPLEWNHPGHVLVIPRRRVRNLLDMSPSDLTHVMTVVKRVALAQQRAFGATGFSLIQNNSRDQTVCHAHFHVVPDTEGGPVAGASREQRDGVAAKLRAALAAAELPAPSRASAPLQIEVAADARFKALRSQIADAVAKGTVVSLSIGVIENGRVVWAESFGLADRERSLPATPHTRYGLASLGKSVTATAAMTLVDRGRLGLDEPVSRYLGRQWYRSAACLREPTVRQLLNMSAGIPHGASTYYPPAPRPERDLVRLRSNIAFCPGTVYHYSNYSIAVADEVIAAAAHEPFERYLERAVFRPLGMAEAGLAGSGRLAPPAARYDFQGGRIRDVVTLPRSSRGMSASLADLLRYAAFNLGTPRAGQKPILKQRSLEALHSEGSGLPGALVAMGWGSGTLGVMGRWLVSDGNDMGVQSMVALLPGRKLGVVILSNSSGSKAEEFGFGAMEAAAPGFAAALTNARSNYEGSERPGAPADWRGTWRGKVEASGGPVDVTLLVDGSGKATIALGPSAPAPVARLRTAFGLVSGSFVGRLPLEESARSDHPTTMTLHRSGEVVTGFLTAKFGNERGLFEIPAPITLRREPER